MNTTTYACGCVHEFNGPLGRLVHADTCDAHAARRPIDFTRKPAGTDADLAEIARRITRDTFGA